MWRDQDMQYWIVTSWRSAASFIAASQSRASVALSSGAAIAENSLNNQSCS